MPQFTQNSDWDSYKQVINDFHNDAFQQEVKWIRTNRNWRTEFGEDNTQYPGNSIQVLKGLISYNTYRSWPTTNPTRSGERDLQNMLLFLNTEYLIENGFTNDGKLLNFDPGRDRFEVQGLIYKSMGESHASQTNDSPLLQFIILEREEADNTSPKFS